MTVTVYEMVSQVLEDSHSQLKDTGMNKTAAPAGSTPPKKQKLAGTNEEFLKIADACDHLAKNIHMVNDTRSPQEKLAEFEAISSAMLKRAADLSDQPQDKQHQIQEANSDSVSPKTVTPESGGTGVGGSNAVPSEPNNAQGDGVMEAGQSGDAMPAHQSPKSVGPSENTFPSDSSSGALESNKEMMMAEQPDTLLKQPGGDQSTGTQKTAAQLTKEAHQIQTMVKEGKISANTGLVMIQKRAAEMQALPAELKAKAKATVAAQDQAKPGAETVSGETLKQASALLKEAMDSGYPEKEAKALITRHLGLKKEAEDALFPATISAGTTPVLQSEAGQPSQLSQGAEAGSNTPRSSAPSSGEGVGRDLVNSNDAAMNATKQQAKTQNTRSAMGELLSEKAHSSANDNVLQQSLDNTSGAGVKISAARELLRRLQGSPEGAEKLAKAKSAMDEAGGSVPPNGGELAAPPDDEVPPEAALEAEGAAGAEGAPSDEAIDAAAAGVTPEELAAAELMLAEAEGAEGVPPEAPAEGVGPEEKDGMGGMSMGGGMAGAGSPPPMPMA